MVSWLTTIGILYRQENAMIVVKKISEAEYDAVIGFTKDEIRESLADFLNAYSVCRDASEAAAVAGEFMQFLKEQYTTK